MPEIEISEAQLDALEDLRAALADEHVGAYGHVRMQDAIQFLLDAYESGPVEPADAELTGSEGDTPEDGTTAEAEVDDRDPTERLEAMMNLLTEYEDKWEEADSDDARYVVHLPDSGEERVQTKDDVRAVLFKHYG